jgi:hypothetical protein
MLITRNADHCPIPFVVNFTKYTHTRTHRQTHARADRHTHVTHTQTMKPWILLRGKGIQVDPEEAAALDKLGMSM